MVGEMLLASPWSLKCIIGENYYSLVRDLKNITSNFNSLMEHTIITQVEEVVEFAGEFVKLQNTLKSLTTEEDMRIEKKGVDAYMAKSLNNYIFVYLLL